MQRSEIVNEINNTFMDTFEIENEKLKEDALLFQDLDLDSLDAVDMIVHMESRLGIKIDLQKFSSVKTLSDVYDLAHELVENKIKNNIQ